MLNEKGLCKILKSAYKGGGYQIIPQTVKAVGPAGAWKRSDIVINGATWAVRCETTDLPKAAAVQIVDDAGYLPVEAIGIKKGEPNQLILEGVAADQYTLLNRKSEGEHVKPMLKIPVIFKDRWQLYQTETGEVCAFDVELLKLIDFKAVKNGLECYLSEDGGLGMFFWGDFAVYIAPGRFSAEDEKKIRHVAELDWENQFEDDDPVANISLFDRNADAPLEDRED